MFWIASIGAFASAAMFVYYTTLFPDPLALGRQDPTPIVRVLARDGTELGKRGGGHHYMPLDLLPAHVVGAILATEDRRFWKHFGLDPVGMLRAAFVNARAGRFVQGGSTLTQQLAKNLFLTPARTMTRKLQEITLALWLELRLDKRDILDLYLNRVYFGAGAYGIESAAQRYFDKSSRDLTIGEAAVLAGLLKAPTRYSPAANPEAARQRASVVLARMAEDGVIAPADAERARREKLEYSSAGHGRGAAASAYGYVVDYVVEQLPALLNGGQGELVVETTFDADIQRRAGEIIEQALAARGGDLAAGQAAAVILDPSGRTLAMVGGRSYVASQFNRVVRAHRQPGSVFKPFIYLTALERGLTPNSIVQDAPLNVDGWMPRNDSGTYAGAIPLRRALAKSINSVSVRLTLNAGPRRVIRTARRLGIQSTLRPEASLALGTQEVTLLELAGAYGIFANGGRMCVPYVIRRIRTSEGRTIYEVDEGGAGQVVDPIHAAGMTDMLSYAIASGTGKRAAVPGHPAAGKTGTSQDFRDAWFLGYTAQAVAGVWVGNDDGKSMNGVMGGGLPAEMWRELMVMVHTGKPSLDLPGGGHGDELPSATAQADLDREVLPWHRKVSDTPRRQPTAPIELIDRKVRKPVPPGSMSLGANPEGFGID